MLSETNRIPFETLSKIYEAIPLFSYPVTLKKDAPKGVLVRNKKKEQRTVVQLKTQRAHAQLKRYKKNN